MKLTYPKCACLGVVLVTVALGCDGEPDVPQPSGGDASIGSSWQLSPSPLLTIGGNATGPGSDLRGIVGLVRLEDGRIVVADGAQRLQCFDASGNLLYSVGRMGEGPGEFRMIAVLQKVGPDSLLVYDQALRRVSIFSIDGEFGRSLDVATYIVGSFADGQLVSREELLRAPTAGPPTSVGRIHRLDTEVSILSDDGALKSVVGTYPSDESFSRMAAPGIVASNKPGVLRRLHIEVDANALYIAPGDSFKVTEFSPDGSVREVIRASRQLHQLTTEHLLDAIPGLTDQSVPSLPTEQRLPAITNMLVDTQGNLWLEEFADALGHSYLWTVIGRSGTVVGSVMLPPEFRPFQIGYDYLLGVSRDAYDVERILMFALNRETTDPRSQLEGPP